MKKYLRFFGLLSVIPCLYFFSFGCGGTGTAANTVVTQDAETGSTVTLNGGGSSDCSNSTLTYEWAQISGATVTLSDAAAECPTFTSGDTPETYTFQLVENDNTADPSTVIVRTWTDTTERVFVDSMASAADADGSISKPYTTINVGIAASTGGKDVYVATGTYSENITMLEGVSIFGGYESANWTRDVSNNATTIDPVSPYNTISFGEGEDVSITAVTVYAGSGITGDTYVNGFSLNGPSVTDDEVNAAGIIVSTESSVGPEISDNTITIGSSAAGDAYGLFVSAGAVTISDNIVTGSGSDAYSTPGGAFMIYLNDATATIEGNRIDAGKNQGVSGISSTTGILARGESTATINRNWIDGGDGVSESTIDTALPGSCGVFVNAGSTATIENNIIYAGNGYATGVDASWDSIAILVRSSLPADVINNTIYLGGDAQAANKKVGVSTFSTGTMNIVNNIILKNDAATGVQASLVRGAAEGPVSPFGYVYNNDFDVVGGGTFYMYVEDLENPVNYDSLTAMVNQLVLDGTSTSGNIEGDPLFQTGSDYILKAGSPCIDTGCSSNCGVTIPSTDYSGDPRPADAIDIGANEYQ